MSDGGAADRAPMSRRSSNTSFAMVQGALVPLVQERLAKALGPKRAGEVLLDAMGQLRGRSLETPQDLLDFSHVLEKGDGLVLAVARTLKVQALLQGAVER